jgi:PAS domain S-box-containing protein
MADSWARLERTCTDAGEVVTASPAWLEWSGLSPEQVLGRAWWRFVHAEDRSRLRALWDEAARSGAAFQCCYRLALRGGTKIVLERVTPFEQPGAERVWQAHGAEITEAVTALNAHTLDASSALVEFDESGRLRFATREAQKLLGCALPDSWTASLERVLEHLPRVHGVQRASRDQTAAPTPSERVLGRVLEDWTLEVGARRLTLRLRAAPAATPLEPFHNRSGRSGTAL